MYYVCSFVHTFPNYLDLLKFIRGTVHRNLPPDTAQDHLVSHSHTLTLNMRVWLHEIKDHLQEGLYWSGHRPTGSMVWIVNTKLIALSN